MKLRHIFKQWGWTLGFLGLLAELCCDLIPRAGSLHPLRPYLQGVWLLAGAGFSLWLLQQGLFLRRVEPGSIWQKSWPGCLLLGTLGLIACIATLFVRVAQLLAKH